MDESTAKIKSIRLNGDQLNAYDFLPYFSNDSIMNFNVPVL